MSWPHILSFSRVIAGPVVAALILYHPGNPYLLAAIFFGLASLTDLVDGKLARYSQQVSPLGIFIDTTSDKILVCLTLVALAIAGLCAAWIPLVVVGREFLISGLRSYAASRDRIISSHLWGKGKTALTMVAIFFVLISASGRDGGSLAGIERWGPIYSFSTWVLVLAGVLTVISGLRYIIDAWPLLASDGAGSDDLEDQLPVAAARK